MELRQLEYFLAVIESGSFSKAATLVGVAQPALSRQMRQLEDELSTQLFYRHGRGARLTREGEQFQAVVAPILRDLTQVKSDLRDASAIPAGEISVGMPPSFSEAIGAELVAHASTQFPHVKLHLVDGLSGFINEWLASGRIDMAVINNARRSPYIRMDYLMTMDLFLFGRRRDMDALARDAASFPTSALPGIPLLLVGQNHGLRRALDAACRRLSLDLDIKAEVDALSALKKLILAGHGFTILPYGVIKLDIDKPEFGFRRLADPGLRQDFMLAFSLQRPTTRAMQELARYIREETRRALADGRLSGKIDAAEADAFEAPGA